MPVLRVVPFPSCVLDMIPITDPSDRSRLDAILSREATFSDDVDRVVDDILGEVRRRGDEALIEFSERFDGVRPDPMKVPEAALAEAEGAIDDDLREILREAEANIRRFHARQVQDSWFTEDGDGVLLGQRVVPMERAGLYVPGGTAFYPSSLLMNVIPAQEAGVSEIHLVSPPKEDGLPHPLVMATAHLLGVEHVYGLGGAQAVGALAFGTSTVPRVDVIVGPGNAYVAAAKKNVSPSIRSPGRAKSASSPTPGPTRSTSRPTSSRKPSTTCAPRRSSSLRTAPSLKRCRSTSAAWCRSCRAPTSSASRSIATARASSLTRWTRPWTSSTTWPSNTWRSWSMIRGRP